MTVASARDKNEGKRIPKRIPLVRPKEKDRDLKIKVEMAG
jgi:hypothetical protein